MLIDEMLIVFTEFESLLKLPPSHTLPFSTLYSSSWRFSLFWLAASFATLIFAGAWRRVAEVPALWMAKSLDIDML